DGRGGADRCPDRRCRAPAAGGRPRRAGCGGPGLSALDRRALFRGARPGRGCSAEHYSGGPGGAETLSAALGEERDVIEEVIEPFLVQQGLVQRTPRGRILASGAYRGLGLTPPAALPQLDLLAGIDDE